MFDLGHFLLAGESFCFFPPPLSPASPPLLHLSSLPLPMRSPHLSLPIPPFLLVSPILSCWPSPLNLLQSPSAAWLSVKCSLSRHSTFKSSSLLGVGCAEKLHCKYIPMPCKTFSNRAGARSMNGTRSGSS